MVDAVGRGQYGYSSPETTEHRPVDALRRAPMARRCALRVAAVMGCEFDVCAVGRARRMRLSLDAALPSCCSTRTYRAVSSRSVSTALSVGTV